jgi:hypothetical protein
MLVLKEWKEKKEKMKEVIIIIINWNKDPKI